MLALDWFVISGSHVTLNVDDNDVNVEISKVEVGGQWYMRVNGTRFASGGASIKVADVRTIEVDCNLDQEIDLSFVTGGMGGNGFMLSGGSTEPVQIRCLGDDKDNIVRGTGFADNIQGGSGHDVIIGNGGYDTLYGGAGMDAIFGHGGQLDEEQLLGWSHKGDGEDNAQDTIHGGDDYDYIDGGGGNDILNGNGYWDEIHGNTGNDTIHGNEGDDFIYGEAGNDTIFGDEGSDNLSGGDGNDSLTGSVGHVDDVDTLDGGANMDNIHVADGEGNDFYAIDGADNVTDDEGDEGFTPP